MQIVCYEDDSHEMSPNFLKKLFFKMSAAIVNGISGMIFKAYNRHNILQYDDLMLLSHLMDIPVSPNHTGSKCSESKCLI